MSSNIVKARKLLETGGYTCVLCKEEVLYTSKERGIAPLLKWIDTGEAMSGFSAADKIVGKAAAFLYVILGVREVYAPVMSEAAKGIFLKNGIAFSYDILVEAIRNRTDTGSCPMDAAVRNVDNAYDALSNIRDVVSRRR
ncbi:MAG: DUF1893 domain-containing protein [Wujia sp.]